LSPSPFLGFSGVRARSVVFRDIMSIKSYSLVTLPLPAWVLVGFVHDLWLLGLICQSNRFPSSSSHFLDFSGVRARSLVIRVNMSIKSYSLVTLPLSGF
jgi:hypothetical protein